MICLVSNSERSLVSHQDGGTGRRCFSLLLSRRSQRLYGRERERGRRGWREQGWRGRAVCGAHEGGVCGEEGGEEIVVQSLFFLSSRLSPSPPTSSLTNSRTQRLREGEGARSTRRTSTCLSPRSAPLSTCAGQTAPHVREREREWCFFHLLSSSLSPLLNLSFSLILRYGDGDFHPRAVRPSSRILRPLPRL